jgi:hypothetical protein
VLAVLGPTSFVSFYVARYFLSPVPKWQELTRLKWPSGARVIAFGQDSGWQYRRCSIVLSVDEAAIKEILAHEPPWNKRKWQRGPPDSRIGISASFLGIPQPSQEAKVGWSPNGFDGDPTLVALYESPRVYYVADNHGGRDGEWFIGTLPFLIQTPRPSGLMIGVTDEFGF